MRGVKRSRIKQNGKSADLKVSTDENKNDYTDIICACNSPCLPSQILGDVKEIYIKSIDYMIGMKEFEEVFYNLNIFSNHIGRESSVYSVIDNGIVNSIKELSNDDINNISNYTNRVESSSLYSTVGFDLFVLKHLQLYHSQDLVDDIEGMVLHKFIELQYLKSNLIIHLKPYNCMVEKGIPYDEALSYCISIMWATLINIVHKKAVKTSILDLLKQVFHDLNPILTKIEVCSVRTLTPNGYSFIQELSQLTSAEKFITIKTPPNRVIVRWSPRSERFENTIYKTYRKEIPDWDDIKLLDDRADSNGKHCVKYDCRIAKGKLITKITIVGQNRMRDITGYRTTPIYGLLCDEEMLEHYELSTLFVILTGTQEHKNSFNLVKARMDVKTAIAKKFEFIKSATDKTCISDKTEVTTKCKCRKTLPEIFSNEENGYTPKMVALAVKRLNKKVFQDLETNNDFYIATQLINSFNMKRNVHKDIMTVLKMAGLTEKELPQKLKLVERHKRPRIKEMVEFVKTLEPQRHILHILYNYLWTERYV